MISEIKTKLTEAGASLIGFADISNLPANVTRSMKSAISIAAALDASIGLQRYLPMLNLKQQNQ